MMPLYEFLDEETGKVEDKFYPMGKAPQIGSYIRGTKLRRLPPGGHSVAVDDVRIVAEAFSPWQGCDFVRTDTGERLHPAEIRTLGRHWGRLLTNGHVKPVQGKRSARSYDNQGRPRLRSRREANEFAARNGYRYERD